MAFVDEGLFVGITGGEDDASGWRILGVCGWRREVVFEEVGSVGYSVSTVSRIRKGYSIFYEVVSACMFFESVEDAREDEGIHLLRPEEVEMFKVRDFFYDCVTWEFFEHDLNINQAVSSTVHKDNGCLDIPCGEFGNFVVSVTRP